MAVKEWVRRLRPVPLYLTLALTALLFAAQLAMSHMTHALTLLVDAYHMLCNLIALTGCIITIKYGSASAEGEEEPGGSAAPTLGCHTHLHESAGCSAHHTKHHQNEHHKHQITHHHHHHHHSGSSSERRLKNTFGWARIDVLVMLIGCVFLTSLCFSLVVEALQTLIHIDHHDEMHHPIPVLVVGCVGLLVNGLCYLLIGGYTFHQASFLHVTPNGEVVLDHVMNQDSVRKGQRRLSAQTRKPPPPPQNRQRQGPREMCRDIIGCIFVIACALIVYLIDKEYAKYVDPVLSIVSAITLLILSYPYMRESGSILLQTIPDTINIHSLREELLKAFPDILNVHDLHVWRLTASRVFSTAHIIFLNNKDYSRITKEITNFFHDQGITSVTIQPEFFQAENGNGIIAIPNIHDDQCLVPCLGDGCYILHCCANNSYKLTSVSVSSDQQKQNKNDKPGDIPKRNKQMFSKMPKDDNLQETVNSPKTNERDKQESPVVNNTTIEASSACTPSDSKICSQTCDSTNKVCAANPLKHEETTNLHSLKIEPVHKITTIKEKESKASKSTEIENDYQNISLKNSLSDNVDNIGTLPIETKDTADRISFKTNNSEEISTSKIRITSDDIVEGHNKDQSNAKK